MHTHEQPKLYLAGPMRGYADSNFPAFDQAAEHLRSLGYEVFNPADKDREDYPGLSFESNAGEVAPEFDLRNALAQDTWFIAKFSAGIAVLPGWEASAGARAEVSLALALGLPVMAVVTVDVPDDEGNPRSNSGVFIESVPPKPVKLPTWGNEISAHEPPMPRHDMREDWQKAHEILNTSKTNGMAVYPPDEKRTYDREAAQQGFVIADEPPAHKGETRIVSSTGGAKGQKLDRFDLMPAGPLQLVARLYGIGARKYAERNWEAGYNWSLSYGALQRHVNAFWRGEEYDAHEIDCDEDCTTHTNLPHLACAVFHCFALLEYMNTHREFDDRPKNPEK